MAQDHGDDGCIKEPSNKPRCSPAAPLRRASSCVDISQRARRDPTEGMQRLAGGRFLMGTDYAGAFPHDGEGPIRDIDLSPFWIGKVPVTNEDFERFVRETGYRTDAERFGWSFVFWAHVPKHRFKELVVDTVASAEWWWSARLELCQWIRETLDKERAYGTRQEVPA